MYVFVGFQMPGRYNFKYKKMLLNYLMKLKKN